MKNTFGKIYRLSMIMMACIFIAGFHSCDSFSKGDHQKLRVLTYNIHHANPPSKENFIDLDAIAKVINDQKPDLVALQEVDVLTERSGKVNQMEELANKTGLNFYYGKAIDYEGGEYGIGMLSKFPLEETKTIHLPNPYHAEPRVLAMSNIHLPNSKVICFAVTHLDVSHKENRDEQAKAINKITGNIKLPVILAGDLNATPESRTIKILEQQFDRSCDSCGFTIPVNHPKRTIDHILTSKNSSLKPLSTTVIQEHYASDHLPVLAVFGWNEEKQFSEQDATLEAARQVIQRTIGQNPEHVQLEKLEISAALDTYEVEAGNGRLTIRGNSSVAISHGFYNYLKDACHGMVTWSGKHVNLSEQWPNYSLTKGQSPYRYRYYLNVVTFGYTTPYWDWNRWEKELDWMALHGMNMPLALVASEAIAERVWLKMGLPEDEIRSFFTGPAYLPWHRMGNLNRWDGPLTENWQIQQLELQHKILQRMRELGMHPVAPAFAGFVPAAFQERYPEAKVDQLKWGGFPKEDNACVLSPQSPFFKQIGKLFIEEWEKEFGKNDFYLSDSFNEMDVPVSDDHPEEKYELLADYGKAIYESIAAGNPDAVWITQGWTFGYQHKFWDQPSLKALLSQVPDDKMMILDLGNEYPDYVWHIPPVWQTHDGFYGKQWVYSFVPNFGGKTPFTGVVSLYASGPAKALHSPYGKTMAGFGFAPEGIENNEFVYELLADIGWTTEPIKLNEYVKNYSEARYGAFPEEVKKAYDELLKSCYNTFTPYPRFLWQLVTPDIRRRGKVNNDADFMLAVENFLKCSDQLQSSELYQNDAIEMASFYLSIKADGHYKKALNYLNNKDKKLALTEGEETVAILEQVDRLLASHPSYNLNSWIKMARDCGITVDEKNRYDADAKRLISTWGGHQEDYAARVWSGLIRDYYIPRIKMHLTGNDSELERWQNEWVETPGTVSTNPFSNPLEEAKQLVAKYAKN